jgi:DNA-binding transcriptional LysR family regulator
LKRLPPLHCLQALEAVARRGAVVDAADELHVTPSAISHRLRQLESWLGRPLIARAQPLTLTAYAAQYASAARDALSVLAGLPQPANAARTPLRVAVPPTFARNILVPRLASFTRAHPQIELELNLTIPLLDVKAGESEVEVRFGAGQYGDADNVELLLAEPVSPVASPAYLARVGVPQQPADLARMTLLRSPLEPWRCWFDAANLPWQEPASGVQFNDVGLLMEATIAGHGVALARPTIIAGWLETGLLRTLFDIRADSPHAYWLLYDRDALGHPEVAAFIDWLRAAVHAPPSPEP